MSRTGLCETHTEGAYTSAPVCDSVRPHTGTGLQNPGCYGTVPNLQVSRKPGSRRGTSTPPVLGPRRYCTGTFPFPRPPLLTGHPGQYARCSEGASGPSRENARTRGSARVPNSFLSGLATLGGCVQSVLAVPGQQTGYAHRSPRIESEAG